jgi:hypothetical protein
MSYLLTFEFTGELFEWRGPAPFYFVAVPQPYSDDIRAVSKLVTYGWGVIPVTVKIGGTEWTTSLFPKDDVYLVPIRANVRKREDLQQGDAVAIELEVGKRDLY